ncbi:hypothetical protein EJ04DRAFT_262108 [Polyplosphaeria fusca]|uniref:Uncharacterized protein n=1 Tax=Polyplosphaeria fusca TaxID=682080 RepID=A0A9P4RBG6_9PLEO|nr:hypothetical protein EJ04DRAFT_262108 [Polyplosphaeria fusca]
MPCKMGRCAIGQPSLRGSVTGQRLRLLRTWNLPCGALASRRYRRHDCNWCFVILAPMGPGGFCLSFAFIYEPMRVSIGALGLETFGSSWKAIFLPVLVPTRCGSSVCAIGNRSSQRVQFYRGDCTQDKSFLRPTLDHAKHQIATHLRVVLGAGLADTVPLFQMVGSPLCLWKARPSSSRSGYPSSIGILFALRNTSLSPSTGQDSAKTKSACGGP